MDKDELSVLPAEARRYQGTAAGIATRFAAAAIDGFVVAVSLLAGYGGYVALRLVLSPGGFQTTGPFPVAGRRGVLLVGGDLPGVRVVDRRADLRRSRHGGAGGHEPGWAAPVSSGRWRAPVLCAVFPIGLLWCAVDPKRRSLQDIVLRTSVVYNWLPRAWTTEVPARRQRRRPRAKPPDSRTRGTTGRGASSAG